MLHLFTLLCVFLLLPTLALAGSISFGNSGGFVNATVVSGNAVDDQVILGTTDSAAVWATLPSCSNGTTSKLLYDNSTNTWSCGTDQGGVGSGDIGAVGACDSGECGVEAGLDIFPLLHEGTANTFETTWTVVDPTADRSIVFPNNSGTVAVAVTAPVTLSATGVVALTQNAGTDVTADLEEEGAINATAVTGNVADDQVLLGSGASAATWATIPNCGTEATDKLLYTQATNTWSCVVDQTGGGGSSIILDRGDDAVNESTALAEIATSGDTNSVFTEPSADKLLIDLAQDWPKADTADDLTCTDCIGPTEITDLTLGTDTAGNYAGSASEAGPATTALALDANPADCGANTFANAIAASGALTCAAVGNAATTATDANTASAIVARDISGNFTAGTITAALTGNASTATALAANGTNCNAGEAARGVDAAGNAEDCFAPTSAGGSALNFGAIPDGACAALTFVLTGAATGDALAPAWPSTLETGLFGTMLVSAVDTVQVRLCNLSGAEVNPASQTFGAALIT